MQTEGNKFDLYTLKRLLAFVKPYSGKFVFLIVVIVLSAILAPVVPYLISITINEELIDLNFKGLLYNVFIMLGVLLFQSILSFLNTYLSGWLGQSIIKDIRVQLYEHILKLKLKFFDNIPIGQLVTRNISDIQALADVFSQGLAAIVADTLQLVFIFAFMFWHNWQLTLVSLITLPFLLFSTYVFKEKIKSSYDAVRTAVSKLNTFVQEHVTGMSVVQIFNSEERELLKFKGINERHKNANLKSVKYYSIYFPVVEVIGAVGIGLLLWYGAHGLVEGSVDNIGDLIAFIMYLNMFFRPLRMIADRFNTLQMGLISTARIIKLFDNKEFIGDEGVVEGVKINGEIEFDNVQFSYNQDSEVLKGISFKVKPGETVAFVGATGAGKSSVVNLLNRLYEINGGLIKIDDLDIKQYKLDFLRRKIGVVLQDVFLFSKSIRENITLGDDSITDADIWTAAESIGAKKFIDKLPGKLDYLVQERGLSLSVGQRQLVSFIRAMVYDPKILILDEATSSVDSETETLIQSAIHKMMEGRTAIVVAHRLSTIQDADKIIVLEKGELKESGNHQELISKKGYYHQLYNLQYKNVS